MKILGISRGSQYSPNHISNDAAIFNGVMQELQKIGFRVVTCTEEQFVSEHLTADVIVDMARDQATLQRLLQLEREGSLIINSPQGIENCVRLPMTKLLLQNSVPHPESVIIKTQEEQCADSFPYPCWIKRGDSHALVKEDVCYATTPEEAKAVLADFRNRHIPTAVINKHLQGDLIKFYGVQGTDFFYWFYPSPCSHSKFGLEKINGVAKGFPFDVEVLRHYATQASKVLHVPIYGGDAVVL